MAGTADEDTLESATEDEEIVAWVTQRAEGLDLEPSEFLERVVKTYRIAESRETIEGSNPEEVVEELTDTIEAVEAEFNKLIEDVRERVIQVKQEADAKAPMDHDHEELAGQIEKLNSDLSNTDDRVSDIETRFSGGFENFEEIIEHLFDRTERIQTDIETLGSAIISLRERTEQIMIREQARGQADRLKNIAAQYGVRKANCQSCGSKVDLAMLSEGTCPTCEAVFSDLDPNPGFFGTSVLETGSRPALKGASDVPDTDDLESVVSGHSGTDPAPRPEWSEGVETKSESTRHADVEGAEEGTDGRERKEGTNHREVE